MSPEDPRHGTVAGYQAHRRDSEPACRPCKSAKSRYEKGRAVYGNRLVSAVGTRRRVQALKAMGHSGADIAARLGITFQAVHKIEHGASTQVCAVTAEKIRQVYKQMCMTVPEGRHRTRIRNQSLRRGYAPPLAWDNIDDPDEHPTGWQYTPTDRAEALHDLTAAGAGLTEACRRLDITAETLQKWCSRHGHSDLYRALAAREGAWNQPGRYGRESVA